MSRRPQTDTEASGQDSFLDVVANLVGVLIILVMVVGTQAKAALDAAASAAVASQAEPEPQLVAYAVSVHASARSGAPDPDPLAGSRSCRDHSVGQEATVGRGRPPEVLEGPRTPHGRGLLRGDRPAGDRRPAW